MHRDQANEWYNRIKKAVILGDGETVIDEFVEDSEAIREEDEMYVFARFARIPTCSPLSDSAWTTLNFFMTHFALYRRSLGLTADEDSIRTLLEAYIDQLGGLPKADSLVAIYSAELESGDRERAYAKYLECESSRSACTRGIQADECRPVETVASATEDLSFEGKQQALEKAQQEGLDARKIANIVSSRVGDIIDVSAHSTVLQAIIR